MICSFVGGNTLLMSQVMEFQADRKAAGTQISALYNCGELKSISACTPAEDHIGFHGNPRVQCAQDHQDWTVKDWNNVTWTVQRYLKEKSFP